MQMIITTTTSTTTKSNNSKSFGTQGTSTKDMGGAPRGQGSFQGMTSGF